MLMKNRKIRTDYQTEKSDIASYFTQFSKNIKILDHVSIR